ncbi:MAG: phosphatase PAP2 family protein [Chitinophagaceae bacterium]|nr:phosphatase PAP2 family protein [Chitinophagaceae bacterium]
MYLIIFLTIKETLLRLDRELFTFIHQTASSPLLDWFFLGLRHELTWIPLYAFILYWATRYHRAMLWKFIFLSLVTFAITDFTSSSILKPLLMRERPCYDSHLQDVIRNIIGCGGRYGLPSSHASNHFGIGSFWFFTISWMGNRRWYWLWFWAFIICYAQVYVGKHFPGDVILGAILGTCVGILTATLFKRWAR